MSKIFISYAYADGADIARQLASELEAAGSPCWMVQRDLKVGEDFPPQIVKAIRECQALVVLLTPGSNASRDVLQEVHLAHNACKPMVPVVIRGTPPSDGLAYYVGIVQQIQWGEARMVAAAVRSALTGTKAQEDPARREAQEQLEIQRQQKRHAEADVALKERVAKTPPIAARWQSRDTRDIRERRLKAFIVLMIAVDFVWLIFFSLSIDGLRTRPFFYITGFVPGMRAYFAVDIWNWSARAFWACFVTNLFGFSSLVYVLITFGVGSSVKEGAIIVALICQSLAGSVILPLLVRPNWERFK